MCRDEEAQDYLRTRQLTRGVHHGYWENPLDSADATAGRELVLVSWDHGTHQCFFTRQALYLDLSEDERESAECAMQ
jgi:hypothetical protein